MKKSTTQKRVLRVPASHPLSRLVRAIFERREAKMVATAHLATFAIIASIVEPHASFSLSRQALAQTVVPTSAPTVVSETPVIKTETTLVWPVKQASISQGYHFGHPGIDITSPDREIQPIDKGKVVDVQFSKWFAYGNHVVIEHPNGRKSLYAHLESIKVHVDDEVTRETVIGIMGQTGWATGIHLHLEVYQDGKTVSPLEVLPLLEKDK